MKLKIKRLDHHGIVAGIIDDLNIVPLLDQHLPQDDKQEITPSEAIKGMIMNGVHAGKGTHHSIMHGVVAFGALSRVGHRI